MAIETLPRGSEAPAGVAGEILQIPLELIDVDENVRKGIADASIEELAASIAEHGVRQPISVRDVAGDRYAINFGQRRFLASKMAGKLTIPAFVDNEARTPAELAIHQLVENLAREDLPPLDRARAMRAVVDAGMTQAELARKLGIGASTVTNDLGLLEAPASVQEAIVAGQITPAHAKAIKGLSVADQEELLEEALEEHLSAHELEEAVQQHKDDAEWRAAREAENLEAARAAAERYEEKLAELVKKVPLDTPIRISGDTWNDVGKARLKATRERLVAAGFKKLEEGRAQGRPKGFCNCTAWRVEVGYNGGLTIAPACIVAAHHEAAWKADREKERAKYALQENVQRRVRETSVVRPIAGATAAAVGLSPDATVFALPRLLAEGALWSLLAYRLPEWSVARGGKRNTAWAVIRALSDEDLAAELGKELANDFRDKAGYHIDWPKLAADLGLDETGKPKAAAPKPIDTRLQPAFGDPVVDVDGGMKYRIRQVLGNAVHLAESKPTWRNGEVVALADPARLTYDKEAGLWRGPTVPAEQPAAVQA